MCGWSLGRRSGIGKPPAAYTASSPISAPCIEVWRRRSSSARSWLWRRFLTLFDDDGIRTDHWPNRFLGRGLKSRTRGGRWGRAPGARTAWNPGGCSLTVDALSVASRPTVSTAGKSKVAHYPETAPGARAARSLLDPSIRLNSLLCGNGLVLHNETACPQWEIDPQARMWPGPRDRSQSDYAKRSEPALAMLGGGVYVI